jgi:hypothetical protein
VKDNPNNFVELSHESVVIMTELIKELIVINNNISILTSKLEKLLFILAIFGFLNLMLGSDIASKYLKATSQILPEKSLYFVGNN